MKKIKCISFLFALFLSIPCFAQETISEQEIEVISKDSLRTICGATIIEDSSKIIINPGNCPIEILRRFGRVLSKHWPEGKKELKSATILINENFGTPNFVKSISWNNLPKKQQENFDQLLDSHSESLKKLLTEFNSASEAITVKIAMNLPQIKNILNSIINNSNNNDSNKNSVVEKEKAKVEDTLLPVLEAINDGCGVFSISENGIFGRANIVSNEAKLKEFIPIKNLTIDEYIDYEPLIILAQTHGVEDPEKVMKHLESIPNMPVIKQMVASAGIDFEKDLIGNYARESILYVNLTPTGEMLIPDVRWVVLVPDMPKLVSILPKLRNLCMQTGIFVNSIVDDSLKNTELVKLSHFMLKNYGVFASLVDNFCVLSSTKEGAIAAITHLKNNKKSGKVPDFANCNMYFRIKTADLNLQLQQFLQSPLIRDKGIPPITNLTFLNDMNNITARTIMTDNKLEVILDIPFIKNLKNK